MKSDYFYTIKKGQGGDFLLWAAEIFPIFIWFILINKYYFLSKKYSDKIDFAIKFQYRDSNTFIHKSFQNSLDKTVQRFKTTFLTKKEWKEIIKKEKAPKREILRTLFFISFK